MQLYGDDAPVRFTGSTHDERAYITKKPATVDALNRHLVDKIERHRDEIEMAVADLEPGATTLFVSYGVTAGSMREAVAQARRAGTKVSALTLHSLWPVPETALTAAADGIERIVVAELNPGLYRREIERVLPDVATGGIERIDGRLVAPSEFLAALA
jgi:pyruvate/2-oxoacid:ferredoxin oxidoreductase alpha subunit